ncbi:MAG: UDP-N-acetylmuramate dehydrogenase [Syntrophomonadaceae bacterium]|nr:UDP-N-acetylmuramate dehydrogenase [Syntrophomonadaceae bacterium]
MYSKLKQYIPEERIKKDEPMSNHTTFRIGGPVGFMVLPQSILEVQQVLQLCRQEGYPVFVFGLGSNLLVSDRGFSGAAIKLGNHLKSSYISGDEIFAEAGIRLSELSKKAAASGLSGLEFAEGIPGSLGGAVVMNAGAYGGEIKDVLVEILAMDPDGNLITLAVSDLKLGYRSSILQNTDLIVLSALLKLKPDQQTEIKARMKEFAKSRREKQPLEYPSAGSTFKRPEGVYVGPLLEQMGLKGFSIGGAQVSVKHAGFIVNTGNATARDVMQLIRYIQKKARDEHGVELESEIRIIGQID